MANNTSTATINIKALLDNSDILNKVKQTQQQFNNLKLPNDKLSKSFSATADKYVKSLEEARRLEEKGFTSNKDVSAYSRAMDEVTKSGAEYERQLKEIAEVIRNTPNISTIYELPDDARKKISDFNKEIAAYQEVLKTSFKESQNYKTVLDQIGKLSTKTSKEKSSGIIASLNSGDIDGALAKAKEIEEMLARVGNAQKARNGGTGQISANVNTSLTAISKIITELDAADKESEKVKKHIADLVEQKKLLESNQGTNLAQNFTNQANAAKLVTDAVNDNKKSYEDAAASQAHLTSEMDQMKSRIQYFFGLNNAIQLLKRSIQQAFNTVKELDKAMTETAVVTDFTVGDMWKQLPKYTKIANELGVTTKGAYETMTLFYQQGLNTNEAFEIGTETMKMARIAGLDYATATDYMTAALRGFNMELNETSAQRVNDVYSKLAAITASDTQEISVAMTKTASLAHNANMEFETTSAYLSQIIETTRESAETAGTALKTVIARFTELKKDPALIEEVDGEAVDANKIETALRSIGVALRDDSGQFRNLDEVFLDINKRWDSLSTNQQRYIATMAAGSRQQSRFIAMMSDYERTQELMDAAYNSNGASAEQFGKTQESLESKLNRLKNAWNEFTMGLANNVVIKGAVDALTGLLTLVDKLTSGFGLLKGGIGDAIGALLKLGVTAGTLKVGGMLASTVTGKVASTLAGKKLSWTDALQVAYYNSTGNEIQSGQTLAFGNAVKGSIVSPFQKIFSKQTPTLDREFIKQSSDYTMNPARLAAKQEYYNAKQTGDYNKIKQARQHLGDVNNQTIAQLSQNPNPQLLKNSKFLNTGLGKLGSKIAGTKGIFGKIGTKAAQTGFLGLTQGAAGAAAAIGSVTLAAGAAAAAVALLYRVSPAGQVKNAEQYAKAMEAASESAKKQAEASKQAAESYKEAQDTIIKATNKLERQSAIAESNEKILQMIEQNSKFGELLQTGEFGQLTLEGTNSKGQTLNDLIAEDQQKAIDASSANLLAQSRLAQKKANQLNSRSFTEEQASMQDGYIIDQKGYNKAQQLKAQADIEDVKSQKLIASAFTQMIGDSIEDSDLKNSVATALSEGYDPNEIKKSKYMKGARFNVVETYEEIYGQGSAEGKDRKDLKKAIKNYNAEQAQTDDLEKFIESIKDENQDNLKTLLDIYNETYTGSATTFDAEEFISNNEILIGKFAEALDEDTQVVKDNIKARTEELKKLQEERRKDVINTYARAQIKANGSINKDNFSNFSNQIKDFTDLQVSQLSAIFNATEGFVNDATMAWITDKVPMMLEDEGTAKELSTLFSQIDLSNPLSAYKRLNTYVEKYKDSTDEIKTSTAAMAEELLKSEDTGVFSKSNLTQSFLLSSSFEEVNKEIEKLIKKNGELTPDNVKELAEGCEDLNLLLEEGIWNLDGLTLALNAINDGAPFEGLTDSIIETLKSVTTLDGEMTKLKDLIDNFEEGFDYTSGVDTYSERIEKLEELTNKFEYGNDSTYKLYDNLFGQGSYAKLIDQNNGDVTRIQEAVDSRVGAAKSLFENDGKGFLDALEKNGSITRNGGTFDWSPESTDDAKKQIIKAIQSQFSGLFSEAELENIAIAGLGRLTAILPGLKNELNENDYTDALNKFVNNIKGINDTKIVSASEAEFFGSSFSYSGQKVTNDLNDRNVTVIDAEIIKGIQNATDFEKAFKNLSISEFFNSYKDDIGGAFEQLRAFGFDDTQISTLIKGINDEFDWFGENLSLTDIFGKFDNIYKEIDNTNFADNINNIDGTVSNILKTIERDPISKAIEKSQRTIDTNSKDTPYKITFDEFNDEVSFNYQANKLAQEKINKEDATVKKLAQAYQQQMTYEQAVSSEAFNLEELTRFFDKSTGLMTDEGLEAAQWYITGLVQKFDEDTSAQMAAEALGIRVDEEGVYEGLGNGSPSWKAQAQGEDYVKGLIKGLNGSDAIVAANQLGLNVDNALKEGLNGQKVIPEDLNSELSNQQKLIEDLDKEKKFEDISGDISETTGNAMTLTTVLQALEKQLKNMPTDALDLIGENSTFNNLIDQIMGSGLSEEQKKAMAQFTYQQYKNTNTAGTDWKAMDAKMAEFNIPIQDMAAGASLINTETINTAQSAELANEKFHIMAQETGEASQNIQNLNTYLGGVIGTAHAAAEALTQSGGGTSAILDKYGLSARELEKNFGTYDLSSIINNIGIDEFSNYVSSSLSTAINDGMVQSFDGNLLDQALGSLNLKGIQNALSNIDLENLHELWKDLGETKQRGEEAAKGIERISNAIGALGGDAADQIAEQRIMPILDQWYQTFQTIGSELGIEIPSIDATVNYKKGDQEPPEDQEAEVTYETNGVDGAVTQTDETSVSIPIEYIDEGHTPAVTPNPFTVNIGYNDPGHTPKVGPTVIKVSIIYDDGGFNTQGKMAHGKLGSYGASNIPGFAIGKNNKNWYGSGIHSGHGTPRNYEGLAQVGEEGPELIVHSDGSMEMAGINGPTFTYVHKNDSIFTNGQTKRLVGQNPDKVGIPGFANGLDPWLAGRIRGVGGRAGGSSSGGKDDKWTNDFDWLYNILEDIEELERDQVKLEEQHEDALKDVSKNYLDLVKLTRDQIQNLRDQEKLQEYVLDGRKKEMQQYLDTQKSLEEFATYNFGDMTIEIDWDKIDALAQNNNKEKYDEVSDYIKKLEEIQGKIDDSEDSLIDIQNEIQDLQERYKDEYEDMEKRIYDAIVETRQKEIDKLSDISNAIEDTNSRILDAVSKAISKQRQDRENNQTEQELAEKERRLAYLRQDSSGNNALEIKELEKELRESRQDYLDNLVDQKLDNISNQEDFAAEQRQEQIDLMKAQLDWQKTFGFFWQEARDLFLSATDENGNFMLDSDLAKLFQQIDNFMGMSDLGQISWNDELNESYKNARAYWEEVMTTGDEDFEWANTFEDFNKELTLINGNGEEIIGIIDEMGRIISKIGEEYEETVEENGRLYKVRYQNYEGYTGRRNNVHGGWYSEATGGELEKRELSREDITPEVGKVTTAYASVLDNSGPGKKSQEEKGYYYIGSNGKVAFSTTFKEALENAKLATERLNTTNLISINRDSVEPYEQAVNFKRSDSGILYNANNKQSAEYARQVDANTYDWKKDPAGYLKAKGGMITAPEDALTGEEGPELLWNKEGGYYYLLGANGPEFAHLKRGDQIFDAKTTAEIMNRPFARISNNASAFQSHAAGTNPLGFGNNTVTINIEASIGSDYDVDKLTEKIKKDLYNSGTYRNVNVINRIR